MFRFPGDFDLVTLVLLSSVFASTVNAILIGFVLCTFSTLMLLLIKWKTTWACAREYFSPLSRELQSCGQIGENSSYLNMNSR